MDFHVRFPLNLKRMRNLVFIVFFVASGFCASAQKVYFIYLQTDDYRPFYVKMNDKIYSSSVSGYLILPNLTDNTYNFSIGFPTSVSESRFKVPIAGKDRGFLIKNLETGLGLFDLQSLSLIREENKESQSNISYQRRNDNFSSLLSKAANDTSLLYAIVVKPDVVVKENTSSQQSNPIVESKPNTEQTVLVKDTLIQAPSKSDVVSKAAVDDTTSLAAIKEEPKTAIIDSQVVRHTDTETTMVDIPKIDTSVVVNENYKRSIVTKHSESSTSEGFGLVFYDDYDGGVDTIRLIIPNPKISLKEPEVSSQEKQNEFIQPSELKKDTVVTTQEPIVETKKAKVPVKSSCRSTASNSDFFKLRRDMAAEETDEAMVAEAKKYFKSKCFSTEQIKNLSALFLTSAGKYLFFDAAYLHVTDQEQFATLESEIKDDYYLKRFKALIGE
jgi:hypothetical protein